MNFKEITGLPRSHAVEEFAAQLEKKLSERGDSITTTKVQHHWDQNDTFTAWIFITVNLEIFITKNIFVVDGGYENISAHYLMLMR